MAKADLPIREGLYRHREKRQVRAELTASVELVLGHPGFDGDGLQLLARMGLEPEVILQRLTELELEAVDLPPEIENPLHRSREPHEGTIPNRRTTVKN